MNEEKIGKRLFRFEIYPGSGYTDYHTVLGFLPDKDGNPFHIGVSLRNTSDISEDEIVSYLSEVIMGYIEKRIGMNVTLEFLQAFGELSDRINSSLDREAEKELIKLLKEELNK